MNTGFWWLDSYVYLCLSMFALMVYRRWLDGELPLGARLSTAPLLIVFFLVDVTVNHTLCRALGPKPYRTWTISQRFEFYRSSSYSSGFNKTLATLTCTVINWFDKGHC